MPYPAQVDKKVIVAQARSMIENDGIEALSLAKLAAALGVKAPSLYRHVKHKSQLLEEVSFFTFQLLIEAMGEATSDEGDSPTETLLVQCNEFRRFAHTNPRTYVLAYTSTERGDEAQLVQLVLPFQRMVAAIVSEERALTALRGLLALIHGFVMLEIHQQLRRGGDLNQAFDEVIRAYIKGWEAL